MTVEICNEIIKSVKHAKEKHPFFAENLFHAACLAQEELGEMSKAINEGKLEQVKAEALDTIAVLVRTVELIEAL